MPDGVEVRPGVAERAHGGKVVLGGGGGNEEGEGHDGRTERPHHGAN